MPMKEQLYFRNISRRWKKEANLTTKLTIFSPYITSTTAETVLLANRDALCSVYTVFITEHFIHRSSSLKTLKKLLLGGCKLFHIDDLHAKIVLCDDFVSIGSQNLTNRGRRNLEASFCSSDQSFVNYSIDRVDDWKYFATIITLEMIEDMETEVAPLVIKYDEIRELSEKIDADILLKQIERDKIERENRDRKKRLAINASKVIKSNEYIFAHVVKIPTHHDFLPDTSIYSLVPYKRNNNDFIHWIVNEKEIELNTKERYLFMDIITGRISWARVNRGQITFFADSVVSGEKVLLGNWWCDLEFKSNWSNDNSKYNLVIIVNYPQSSIKLVYDCYFDLKYITNIQLDGNRSKGVAATEEIELWIEQHKDEFSHKIAAELLSPFKYRKKLLGGQANEFFSHPDAWRKVSLAIVEEYYILISESH